MFSWTKTSDGISGTINGNPFFVRKDSHKFGQVREAVNNKDEAALTQLVDRVSQIVQFSNGQVEVKNNLVFFNGEVLPDLLCKKIISLLDEGFTFEPFINFYERVCQTPSNTVLTQLYDFLEAGEWPLLPDGRVMAYKILRPNPYKDKDLSDEGAREIRDRQRPAKVKYSDVNVTLQRFKDILMTRDYIDIYTGSVPQGLGDVVSVPRNSVDEDRYQTCSYGLHVAAHSYIPHYGRAVSGEDVVVLVAVCPSDWVSVPNDYKNAKARVCRYELLEVSTDLTEKRQALYIPGNDYSSVDIDDEDWDEEDNNWRDDYLDDEEEDEEDDY